MVLLYYYIFPTVLQLMQAVVNVWLDLCQSVSINTDMYKHWTKVKHSLYSNSAVKAVLTRGVFQ